MPSGATSFQKQHPPAFCRTTVKQFAEMLHSAAAGCIGKFVVSVFNGDLPGTITHHPVGQIDGMVDAIMAHEHTPGANVYCGLQLMREDLPRGKRGGVGDIVSVAGIVADMDADTGKIGVMPIEASYSVETSPGNFQHTLLFEKPIDPKSASEIAKALQRSTGADYGTGDIAHVWRPPGTLNWPNAAKIARGRNPEPVNVCFSKPFGGRRYSEQQLRDVLQPHIQNHANDNVKSASFQSRVDTAELYDRLSDRAHGLLYDDGQPDRSQHAARVAEQLHFDGFSLDEATSLCLDRPGKWTERYTDEKLIADIGRLWMKFALKKDDDAQRDAEAAQAFLHANDNDRASPPTVQIPQPTCCENPFDLAAPGGLLTKAATWIYELSPSPIPAFSVMAATSVLTALFGRRYLTPDGLGLNHYTVLVAGSGFGKDRPLKAVKQIASSVGHGHVIGPNDFASDSAIEKSLRNQPSLILPLDEFGIMLSASGQSSESWSRAKRKAILELYSSPTSDWVAKARASDGGKDSSKVLPPIQWPTLSIISATTPGTFYQGLEGDAVSVEDVEWAFGIVARSIKTIQDGAERFMSSSPFEALCKAIMEAVRNCDDPKGLKNADLLRKAGVSKAEPRLFAAALDRLLNGTGELTNMSKSKLKSGGGGGRYIITPKATPA